jgi:hypothetical protein
MSTKKFAPSIRDPESIYERENKSIAKQYNSQPFANGLLLTGVNLSTTTARIFHKLGRPFKGWVVVDSTAGVTVSRDTADTSPSSDIIPLKASGSATVSLWVF